MRRLRELFPAVALTAALSACQSDGQGGPGLTHLDGERANRLYSKMVVRWGGDDVGTRTDIYVRRFDKDGRLALCGYRTPGVGIDEVVINKWFRNARLMVDDEVIAAASFIVPRQTKAHQWDAEARCVQTDLKATVKRLYSGMRIQGEGVTVLF